MINTETIKKSIENIKAYCCSVEEHNCPRCFLDEFCRNQFVGTPQNWELPWIDTEAQMVYKALNSAINEFLAINEVEPRRIYMSSYTKRKLEEGNPKFVIGGSTVNCTMDKLKGVPIIVYDGEDVDFDIV